MAKIFSKQKQQSLQKSKMRKYLSYAAGEVILVVLGILIALAINNWNQNYQNDLVVKEYLSRIKEDIVHDTISFHATIKRNNELRNEIKSILLGLTDQVQEIEEVIKISATYDLAIDQVFTPHESTYHGMISSGASELVTDIEMHKGITVLYNKYEEYRALFDANKKWLDGLAIQVDTHTDIIKFSEDNIDIYPRPAMLNESDWAFLNDPDDERYKLLVRAISSTAWNQKISNDYYLELIVLCRKTLQILEHGLK